MAAVAALYTPQAAGTVSLLVPRGEARRQHRLCVSRLDAGGRRRPAAGDLVASRYGWREVYAGIGAMGCLSFLLLAWRLPRGLVGTPVDLTTWTDVARNRLVVLLLLITTLQMSGQFVIFTFLGPLLGKLTRAGPDAIGLVFADLRRQRLRRHHDGDPHRRRLGRLQHPRCWRRPVLTGMTGWSLGAGDLPVMACSVAIWGMGFASTNSMQQVRLVGAAPALASALGVAEYVGALCRPGDRLGDRRHAVCARTALWFRIRGDGLCRTGAGGRTLTRPRGFALTPTG